MRGTPDYQNPNYKTAILQNDHNLFRVAETGIASVDGRGRLLWEDDFRNGIYRWLSSASGLGIAPVHKYLPRYSYGYGGAVEFDTVGTDGFCNFDMFTALPSTQRMGFETYICLSGSPPDISLVLQFVNDAGQRSSASLFIENTSGDVYIDTPSGTVLVYEQTNFLSFLDRWTAIKLIGDFDTRKYYRLTFGGIVVDLSAYDLLTASTSIPGQGRLNIYATGYANPANQPFYIGAVALIGDEP